MRKENYTYYFSVEGETEKWYLEWLQGCINASADAKCTVKLDVKIQKDPLVRVKSMTILGKTEITHVFDRESEDPVHAQQFLTTLERMNTAQKQGKNIKYVLGYSNFTFELWMILHKADCNGGKNHRRQYLAPLNAAYHENFENLDAYKHEDAFRRVLSKFSLEDVKAAVRRSERLMKSKEESGFMPQKYNGYAFYTGNPSLSIWESIKKILKKCGLL